MEGSREGAGVEEERQGKVVGRGERSRKGGGERRRRRRREGSRLREEVELLEG